MIREEFGLQTLTREGKLHAVEIRVDADKNPVSGGVYADTLERFGGFLSVAGVHTLVPELWDGKTASGKASMTPFTIQGVSFQYSASFSAPVWRKTPPLSGAAARNSEPGRAIVALITAARKKDRAAVRNLLLPVVVRDLDGPSGAEVMEMLATMSDAAISEITVEIVDADLAKGRVTRREGASSESTGMTVKRVSGVWKISL